MTRAKRLAAAVLMGGVAMAASGAGAQEKGKAAVAPPPEPAPAVAATGAKYPAPAPAPDPDALGRGVQRTMALLATSTPQKRNRVRVLFYGQSITEQDWSKRVADDLRRRFPDADLEVENRAIGGFASQLLIRPAEHDVYPFYPDLVIFHVYGANQEYEQIIKSIRSRTTAEVLMQRDHLTKWPPPADQIAPDKDKGAWWDDFMNNRFLPETAKKYGCGLADVRGGWSDYLKANRLEPKDLLKDGVHLNDHGNYLMAELVKRYLVYRPELAATADKDTVRTLVVGKDVSWKDGKLTVPFEGNRVDLIAAPGAGAGKPAPVTLDGKPPSAHPDTYRITRPTPPPWSPLFLARVDRGDAPVVPEEWTLRITAVAADQSSWDYALTGSVTGPDGAGSSREPFTSRSGRVKIDPKAFFHPTGGFAKELPVGYEIKWKVVAMGADAFSPPAAFGPGQEAAVTVVQGVASGPHTLEVAAPAGAKDAPIRAVRVYRPPVK